MRLFFYGTLIAGTGNPLAEDIHPRLIPLGPAVARGRLFAIPTPHGWYPALLPGPADTSGVHGMLYQAREAFSAGDLARLDAYEGDEYRREPIAIRRGSRPDRAEAYIYATALPPTAIALPHGSFVTFLAEAGALPYRAPPSD